MSTSPCAWPGTGWDLHEYRHSALTHLGEQGASLLMLMAKPRHKKPENVRRCLEPFPEALSELTSLLAPGGSRRWRQFSGAVKMHGPGGMNAAGKRFCCCPPTLSEQLLSLQSVPQR
jgi:hypothetical protein